MSESETISSAHFYTHETIDLTRGDGEEDNGRRSDQVADQEARTKLRRTSPPQALRPSAVYVVIHDKEPQDSGSDYNYSNFLPSRQDTTIIGVFYEYSSAARVAGEYVRDTWCDDDEESNEDDDEKSMAPLSHIDWQGEGWFRQETCDANECDDRVHIQRHQVK